MTLDSLAHYWHIEQPDLTLFFRLSWMLSLPNQAITNQIRNNVLQRKHSSAKLEPQLENGTLLKAKVFKDRGMEFGTCRIQVQCLFSIPYNEFRRTISRTVRLRKTGFAGNVCLIPQKHQVKTEKGTVQHSTLFHFPKTRRTSLWRRFTRLRQLRLN